MLQWVPFLSTGLAFASFITGGIVGKISFLLFPQRVYQLFALCGGILVGLIYELVTKTVEQFSETGFGIALGGAIGICLMFILESLFHNKKMNNKELTLQSSIILTIAIGIHNIPSGISLGANFLKGNNDLAFSLLGVLFFHILPEGIALVMLFLLAGKSFLKFSLPALILALILGIGTLIGLLIGNESLKLNSLLLGIAIASICYVAIVEIILKAIKNLRGIQFLTHFILGFIIVSTYLSFI